MSLKLENKRAEVYSFLSRLYLHEVDKAMFSALKNIAVPDSSDSPLWKSGWSDLAEYINSHDESCLEELEVDYARVFLSAGVAQGRAAFPYESVYTSGKKQLGGLPDEKVAETYLSYGLDPSSAGYKVPNDHIGLELGFMAHICGKSKDEQLSFLKQHLFRWYAGFCADVRKYSSTGFYKAVADITCGFMEFEKMWIGEEV